MEKIKAIVLKERDNVATMMNDVKQGESVIVMGPGFEKELLANCDINFGHKVAVCSILSGDLIFKYGESIGRAVQDIVEGEHVHTHNLVSNRGRGDLVRS